MKEFISTYPALAWSIVSVMLALVVVATLWQQVKWWWFNTWVNFPLVGRIASLSRDANEDVAHPGWFTGERTLCQEYKNFVHVQDEHDFNEKKAYLTKAGDNGRTNTPGWIWLLTVSMVFVEALGFSLCAGWLHHSGRQRKPATNRRLRHRLPDFGHPGGIHPLCRP